ncbi:MAG: hypothetical protein GC180_01390 [Bacteroidetes bacterium]|nr:hypothetical protein [Bacteroidota bacterium]
MRLSILAAILTLLPLCSSSQELLTAYEKSKGKKTFTYEEGIRFCERLDSLSDQISLFTYGMTDAGYPLHLLVFDADKDFHPQTPKEVLLINNAIHPGEPDGVEASLMLLRDIATQSTLQKKYENVRILVIPFYNIGGVLNRNSHSRVNQIGPQSYGFRGNAKNYDLNRDFIKADAQNTMAFYQIFHTWNPHVFVDTHVSNGADYQYTMTLISSQEEKYGTHCARLIKSFMLPALYGKMKQAGQEMTPYVNVFGTVPDSGINAFMETPRYSNGYTSLFDCISFVSETHMLKPFDKRVEATRLLLENLLELTLMFKPSVHIEKDRLARNEFHSHHLSYPIPYEWVNSEICDSLFFKGYEAGFKKSKVSGLPRLYYDRSKPYEKYIPYWDNFKVSRAGHSVQHYIVPHAYQKIIVNLAANGVKLDTIKKVDSMQVLVAKIDDFQTSATPYEGHYLHSNTKVKWVSEKIRVNPGDYLITPDARTENFLANVLQPEAPDSYFNWNYFDPILQQKEGFSSYVFEDIAAEILKDDPQLRVQLEKEKVEDPELKNSAYKQLEFVYRHSIYFEKSYRRYPVFVVPY